MAASAGPDRGRCRILRHLDSDDRDSGRPPARSASGRCAHRRHGSGQFFGAGPGDPAFGRSRTGFRGRFPVEDPSRSQFLILERLDQAASTGRVPSALLQHWEEEFEKVALWHFLATPIHGSIDEASVYTDQERVLALSEIGRLRVADPAVDLAAASALIDPAALPTFFEEYLNSRPRADEHVITRAELLAEFAVLDWL